MIAILDGLISKNVFYHDDKDTLMQEFKEVALMVVIGKRLYQYTF